VPAHEGDEGGEGEEGDEGCGEEVEKGACGGLGWRGGGRGGRGHGEHGDDLRDGGQHAGDGLACHDCLRVAGMAEAGGEGEGAVLQKAGGRGGREYGGEEEGQVEGRGDVGQEHGREREQREGYDVDEERGGDAERVRG